MFTEQARTRFRVGLAVLACSIILVTKSKPSELRKEYRVTRSAEMSGLIEAESIVVEPGATLSARGHLVLRAGSVRINGRIVAATAGVGQPAVDLEIASSGDLIVNGEIVGGGGVTPAAAAGERSAAGAGAPIIVARGRVGAPGGAITLRARGILRVGPHGRVLAGSGASGGDAWAVSAVSSETSMAIGGQGGAGGSITLAASSLDLQGQLRPGDGGDGGAALARGANSTERPATIGGAAVARGGDGGASGKIHSAEAWVHTLTPRKLVTHLPFARGGSGGRAEAYPGATGKGEALFTTALRYRSSQAPKLAAEEWVQGEARAVGGRGGNGGQGGRGGAATTGKAADGVIVPRSAGGNGAPNTATGGAGGDGTCSLGVGGNGGDGNDATASAGGNGGDGSIGCSSTTVVDSNNGGAAGVNTATGGAGGKGGECLFVDGAGGRGGSATATAGAHGGNGGCCSDGGPGGAVTARGGAGGNGDDAGGGGNATAGTGGNGGKGGFCPCLLEGPQKDGGNGGIGAAVVANGGNGGSGFSVGDNGGDGGNGTASSGGIGGDAGNGNPAGIAGSGGVPTATGGAGGSSGGGSGIAGHGGSTVLGVVGNSGAPGTLLSCSASTKSITEIFNQSTNTTLKGAIFEVISRVDGSQLRCCHYLVPPGSSPTDTATRIVNCFNLIPPTHGVTVTGAGSEIMITSQTPADCRVCEVANNVTCPSVGSQCGEAGILGIQTIYGQDYGKTEGIPALGVAGLVAMALLLCGAGAVLLWRRKLPLPKN